MPSYRKLPSGNWQAIVKTADGKQITRTDPLKRVVMEWAEDTATDLRRGVWVDPRKAPAAKMTVGQWYERWLRSRVVEAETARGDEGSWRLHLRETFADIALEDLTRLDVKEWIAERQRAGVGPSAIRRALNHLKTCIEGAVDEGTVQYNVARRVSPPEEHDKLPDWYTRREVERITKAMRAVGDEPSAVMVELMCWVGLRWGEAAGLWGTDVDWLRKRVKITHTVTQDGKDKDYPKNSKSVRDVPVPDWIVRNMSALMRGREPNARIFTTRRQGKTLSGANWRTYYFEPALRAANVNHGVPHTCRHTAATWLIQSGVPLKQVQGLLGHGSQQTTERYAHHDPTKTAAITETWKRLDERAAGTVRRPRRRAST